jgi:MATE family multidrug resistance protein
MLVNILGFWLIGLPISAVLSFHFGFGPEGLWWGVVAGLGSVASFLLARVAWKFRGDLSRIRVE